MLHTIASTLACLQSAGWPAPVAEHTFCPGRKWRADYAWFRIDEEENIIPGVCWEVEGGTWLAGGGRHNRAQGFEQDCRKYSEAAILGWCVVRTTSGMVASGAALTLLERALQACSGLQARIHA